MYRLPSTNNIFIPELLQEIARHLPWSALAYFTVLPDPAPSVLEHELCRRILAHLALFILPEHIHYFLQHMESAGAIISGSFVRQLLQEGEDGDRAFRGSVSDLNIIIEHYKDDPMSSCLIDYGFIRREDRIAGPFKSVVFSFGRYLRTGDVDHEVRVSTRRSKPVLMFWIHPSFPR
jgi:hypothetical protein